MKIFFLLKLAVLNTFKRKLKALLAISGIALSSGVMIFLFGVSDGLRQLVTNDIVQSSLKDVVTVNRRSADQLVLDQERVSDIKSISGVGDVQQVLGTVSESLYHGTNVNMPVYGVTQGYFSLIPTDVVTGSVGNEPRTDSESIVVSSKLLQVVGIPVGEAVGKKITVTVKLEATALPENNNQPGAGEATVAQTTEPSQQELSPKEYTIVGVIDRGALPVGYVSLERFLASGLKSVSQLKIRLNNPDKATSVRQSIEQMGFQTTSVQDTIDQVNNIFSFIQRILLIFGIITLIITVFGTFNIITLTLIEETQQIGYLRIMGMQKYDVSFLFIAQSIMLTVSGVVFGIVGGLVTGAIANGAVRSMVDNSMIRETVSIFKIPFDQAIIMLVLSIIVGWVIGKMPAKRAVLIGPLQELKE